MLIPVLNPVGHQSTNCTVRLFLTVAMVVLTSDGVTSPLYIRQQDMNFPWVGSHLVKRESGSVITEVVSSATVNDSWKAFSRLIKGA